MCNFWNINLSMIIGRLIECFMCPHMTEMGNQWTSMCQTLRGTHRKSCNDSFEELLQNDKDYERLGQDSSFGWNAVCHYAKNWI